MDGAFLALVLLASVTVFSAAMVPATRLLAHRAGAVDAPGERKIHSVPTPRLGGVAVYVSFAATVWGGYLLLPVFMRQEWLHDAFGSSLLFLSEAHRVESKLWALLAGATLVFGVGLLDDVFGRRFPVWVKAAGLTLAPVVLIVAGVSTSFLPDRWMNHVVTFLWLFGITNAFNLLDNMDGLSAGVAAVGSSVLLLNAWSLGEFFISLLLVAFIGSLLGFLFYNSNPASVFLGDCGSLFIGFVLAALTLLERYVSHASSTLFPILMPVMICAVPIMDTATVVFIRLRERRPIYVGDARHLSHRLVALGFSRRSAVLLLYLLTLCLGLGAAALTHASVGQSILLLVQLLGFATLVLVLMFARGRAPAQEGT